MSLTLGDILLPSPLSTDSARALAIAISGKILKEIISADVGVKHGNIAQAVSDEGMQVDVMSAYLLFGAFNHGTGSPVSLNKIACSTVEAPRLDSNGFLATMQTLTRNVEPPAQYHYPAMTFINALRKKLRSTDPAAADVFLAAIPGLLQAMCLLAPDVESQAANAMPLVEVLLQRHPELNRQNSVVNRAFAVSARREDVLPVQEEDDEKGDLRNSTYSPNLAPEVSAGSGFEKETGWLLYDKQLVGEALKNFDKPSASPFGGSGKSSREVLLERMLKSPAKRHIVQQPDSFELFGELNTRFPHFSPVIEHLQRHLALNRCGKGGAPVQFPPLLLVGEPGIGKTFFAQYLADALKVYFVERDLSVVTDAMVITGASSTWKDSSPGVVFNSLMDHGVANPLILLNEIDKCSDGRNYRNPLSSLYALLEKRSASSWADEFAGVPVDTSRVNWILTANKGYIPDPIVDRADTFHVRNPTKEESLKVAAFIWKDLVEKEFPEGNFFETELPASVLEYGVSLPSRRLKKLLTSAAGNAVLADRTTLALEDLEAVAKEKSDGGGRPVGFVTD